MGSTSRLNVGCSGTVPPSFAAALAGCTPTSASSTMAPTGTLDNGTLMSPRKLMFPRVKRPARLPALQAPAMEPAGRFSIFRPGPTRAGLTPLPRT